jgi:hypothetical protein
MTVVEQLIGPAFSRDLWQNCLGNELGSPDDEFFESLGCLPIYLPLMEKHPPRIHYPGWASGRSNPPGADHNS